VVGGLVGALLARAVVGGDLLAVSSFIPAFGVSGENVAIGVALSALIGVLAGIVPATMASRLRIVDALRRVA
jgi:putative ABC transport system permease protein